MNAKGRVVARIMKAYNYELIRERKHLVWRHRVTGRQVVTGSTLSDRRALDNVVRAAKANAVPA